MAPKAREPAVSKASKKTGQAGAPSMRLAAVLDDMLQGGDLQLTCDDGSLTVHSQVLALASPDVLAGAAEAAQQGVAEQGEGAGGSRGKRKRTEGTPSVKVSVQFHKAGAKLGLLVSDSNLFDSMQR